VAHNAVRAADLPDLISSVHGALQSLKAPQQAEPEKRQPPVSIKKSITPDFLISLEDGRRYKSLKRHLKGRGLTPEQYREKWGLPADYPMVAPNYAKARSELAKEMGLGQQRKRGDGAREGSATKPRAAAKAAAATTQRLLRNQQDIGDAIKPFYGKKTGNQLTALLKEHIAIAADLIAVARKGDTAAVASEQERWQTNADAIAAFLSSANPNWKPAATKTMMRSHLRLTTNEVVARLTNDWAADVRADIYALGCTFYFLLQGEVPFPGGTAAITESVPASRLVT
jgi:predicted transcriptional regulator